MHAHCWLCQSPKVSVVFLLKRQMGEKLLGKEGWNWMRRCSIIFTKFQEIVHTFPTLLGGVWRQIWPICTRNFNSQPSVCALEKRKELCGVKYSTIGNGCFWRNYGQWPFSLTRLYSCWENMELVVTNGHSRLCWWAVSWSIVSTLVLNLEQVLKWFLVDWDLWCVTFTVLLNSFTELWSRAAGAAGAESFVTLVCFFGQRCLRQNLLWQSQEYLRVLFEHLCKSFLSFVHF